MPSYLTSEQAARLLGKSGRTASRRAREAYEAGDTAVMRIGKAWAASEEWWREHLHPKPMGRPHKHDHPPTLAQRPSDSPNQPS